MTIIVNFGYRHYLTTATWRRIRQTRLAHDNWACARCKSHEGLQVHHRTYDRLGDEHIEDLETLCRSCHMREHGKDPTLPSEMPAWFYRERAFDREAEVFWHDVVRTAFEAGKALEDLFDYVCGPGDKRAENIRRNLHAIMREAAREAGEEWEPRVSEAA